MKLYLFLLVDDNFRLRVWVFTSDMDLIQSCKLKEQESQNPRVPEMEGPKTAVGLSFFFFVIDKQFATQSFKNNIAKI